MVTAQSALHTHTMDVACNSWIPEGQIATALNDVDAMHQAVHHELTDRTGITFTARYGWDGQHQRHQDVNPPYPRPMEWDDHWRSDPVFCVHGLFYSNQRGIWGRPLKHGRYPFYMNVEAWKDGERVGSSAGFVLTLNVTGRSVIQPEEEYLHHAHEHGGHDHHHMHSGMAEAVRFGEIDAELTALRARVGRLETPAVHSDSSEDDSE